MRVLGYLIVSVLGVLLIMAIWGSFIPQKNYKEIAEDNEALCIASLSGDADHRYQVESYCKEKAYADAASQLLRDHPEAGQH